MLDRLMYLKVSCYGGCQVTLALEIGLTTAREDAVSHHTLILTPAAPQAQCLRRALRPRYTAGMMFREVCVVEFASIMAMLLTTRETI